MPREPHLLRHRRIKLIFALILAAIFYAQFTEEQNEPIVRSITPLVLAAERAPVDYFEALIRSNPLAALHQARAHHEQSVADYECIMVKQESLPSGMSEEQEIKVRHRLKPYSVALQWTRNPGLAERVIYVKDRWVDDGEQLAVCQPGEILRKVVKSIKTPIHGMMAKRTARRSIDEFGFKRALDLLIKYSELAKSRDELSLTFCGEGHFDGRAVWVIRRHLPYTGENCDYPDRTAEIYVDKEYHVPIAVYCYSDDERKPENLLGKYEYRNIRFDIGLSDTVFEPATYGM